MKPVVDRLQQRYVGRIEFKRLATDKGDPATERMATSFGVQYVPTFVMLNRDGSRSDVTVGETTEQSLDAKIAQLR
jgi:protein-disulfide isomerase